MECGGDVLGVEDAARAVWDVEQFPELDDAERKVRVRLLRDGFLSCVRFPDGSLGFDFTPSAAETLRLVGAVPLPPIGVKQVTDRLGVRR